MRKKEDRERKRKIEKKKEDDKVQWERDRTANAFYDAGTEKGPERVIERKKGQQNERKERERNLED